MSERQTVALPAIAVALERDLRQLFALNVLLQAVDGFVTYQALSLGFIEGNPILHSAFAAVGVGPALLLFKAKACGLLFLLRRGTPPSLGVMTLWWLAVVYVLFAIVPWLGFLLRFAEFPLGLR